MQDLISRQAAIDAVNKAFDRKTLLNTFVRKVAVDSIRVLPSAQPEIIKCRNCKYYKLGSDGMRYCFKHDDDILWQDDDFCSRAERRTDGD